MLIYSMSVSVDGFIADRDGRFDWAAPSDELFRLHTERVRSLSAHLCGRRLYETMLPWETDPTMRSSDLSAEFADLWSALPKIAFSRTLDRVEGNARLADGSVVDGLSSMTGEVEIGGASLAAVAFELGLIDELRMFRTPIVVGGGTPLLPPVTSDVELELVETREFASGVVYEAYRRAGG